MSAERTVTVPRDTDVWPSLPLEAWRETYATLHLWTQVIGKIRLALAPMICHWWEVTLYLTSRGLTTSPIPYGTRMFQIDFDFLDHKLLIQTADGATLSFALAPCSVADFYQETMAALRSLDIEVDIWTTPVEVEDRTPFEQDRHHAAYDREYAQRCWRILLQAGRVLTDFRARFSGKVSPVHFFWGAFDLAVTRFSGRPAPRHPGAPNVAKFVGYEAYSHEVSSCGFWPGGGPVDQAAFYAYAYPEPEGFNVYPIQPGEAFYHEKMREFLLPYDAVRTAKSPDGILLSFLQSTYEAAANQGRWDRAALEYAPAKPLKQQV
jgi:Family of unknown function (DUF5996)